jgi:hypothetical protein
VLSVEEIIIENGELLGENLSQCHFVHHKYFVDHPGRKPGLRGEKLATVAWVMT